MKDEEDPVKMLARMVYDSKGEDPDNKKFDEERSLIIIVTPVLPRKFDLWYTKILERILGGNKT